MPIVIKEPVGCGVNIHVKGGKILCNSVISSHSLTGPVFLGCDHDKCFSAFFLSILSVIRGLERGLELSICLPPCQLDSGK